MLAWKRLIRMGSLGLTLGLFASSPCHALPVYARQTGLSCIDCHSVWPVLTSDGRLFKTRGYTQTAPEGNTHIPFAIRLTTSAVSGSARTAEGTASASRDLEVPAAVDVFAGGALGEKVGAFVEASASRTDDHRYAVGLEHFKLAYNLNNDHPASVVLMKSNAFGADPYSGLGGIDRLPYQTDDFKPLFLTDGALLSTQDTDNYAAVVHGYLDKSDRWYAAVGVETGGLMPKAEYGYNHVSSSRLKYYGRLVYEMPLDNGGSWYLGGAVLNGTQRAFQPVATGSMAYVGSVQRTFFDTGLQLPFGRPRSSSASQDPGIPTGAPHIFEFLGLVGLGGDRGVRSLDPSSAQLGVPGSAPVGGVYLQSDVFFNRKFGPMVSYESSTIGGTTTQVTGVGLAWLPQLDFKVGVNARFAHDTTGRRESMVGLFLSKYFWVPLPPEKDEATSSSPSRIEAGSVGTSKSQPSTSTPPSTPGSPSTSPPAPTRPQH